MSLTLQTVEALAPDQASLASAKKLLADKKWSGQGSSSATATAWGQCQGSGSKPYYVVIDVADHGYKCTCPSRKFPCKHALALMWRYVSDSSPFDEDTPPEWVSDWLSRRKKTTKTAPLTTTGKSISAIADEPAKPDLSPEEAAKKQATAQKRAQKLKAKTDESIGAGLQELQGWLGDQVSGGLGVFLDNMSERTRQISARLVDAKASTLASYVDELPAVILSSAKHERPYVALFELGRLYLLIKAWQQTPNDVDVRSAIATAPSKESILQDPNTLKVSGVWQVVGEQTTSKKDGLISQATYLVRLQDKPDQADHASFNLPNIALLLDYYHSAKGVKKSASQLGDFMVGELCYYPSRQPLRAFFEQVQTVPMHTEEMFFDGANGEADDGADNKDNISQDEKNQNTTNQDAINKANAMMCQSARLSAMPYVSASCDLPQSYAQHLLALPWVATMPFLLGAGQIKQDGAGHYWYCGESTVLLSNHSIPRLVQADKLRHAFILWRGEAGELISVVSERWGFLEC